MKLNEIEARLDKHPLNRPDRDHHEVAFLIRAVGQLGAERKVFQKLFEAVDDNYLEMAEARPDIYSALQDVSATRVPDPDVLELINETD